MKPFRTHKGRVAPLHRANVDTDQIIPKQFLKRIERTGFGEFLLYDWRRTSDGKHDPSFVLNHPRYTGASVLVAGKNFGCGSSREHAVWALEDFGFRVLIAPSFADIFANNCVKNGVLTVVLSEDEVAEIARRAAELPTMRSRSISSSAKSTTGTDCPLHSRSTSSPAIACSKGWTTSDSLCSMNPRSPLMKPGIPHQ